MNHELGSWVFLVANLAHDVDGWTLHSYVLDQLFTSQVLELLKLTNIASKLRAVARAMRMKLGYSPPDNLIVSVLIETSVWELTEVNKILEHLVHILQERSLDVAVWTIYSYIFISTLWLLIQLFLQLKLTVFTEKLVACLAFFGLEGELETNYALDLLHHLALELVLDLIQLDVKRRNWFRTHDESDLLFRKNEFLSLLQ